MPKFSPKQQIVCIPTHVLELQDCIEDIEFGFVVSQNGNGDCFCRYWNSSELKNGNVYLRTKANSELTPMSMLFAYDKVPQKYVEKAWDLYVEGGLE